jgi:hypothetical protein
MPIRIQRKRTKGWKKPENTVYVGRGTKYGNPFIVGTEVHQMWFKIFHGIDVLKYFVREYPINTEDAVYLYEKYVLPGLDVSRLKDKNLMCFCPLDNPCHVDPLIKKANEK